MSRQHIPAASNPATAQRLTRFRIYNALRNAGLLPAAAYSLAYLQINTPRAPR